MLADGRHSSYSTRTCDRVCGAQNPPSHPAGKAPTPVLQRRLRAAVRLKNRERQAARNRREVVIVPAVPVDLGVVDGFSNHYDAACLEHPEMNWFQIQTAERARPRSRSATGASSGASARALAMREGLTFGIFGGTTPDQRRKMRVAPASTLRNGAGDGAAGNVRLRLEVEFPGVDGRGGRGQWRKPNTTPGPTVRLTGEVRNAEVTARRLVPGAPG